MFWRKILKYNDFGKTGFKVSEIGLGGAGIGHAWGKTTDEECNALIKLALDNGINFFDTSPIYGNGKSEFNIGKEFQNINSSDREKIFLASKIRFNNNHELDNMEAYISASVERSLKRLKVEYIDLIQIHHQVGKSRGSYKFRDAPPEFAPLLNYDDCILFAEIMDKFKKNGKVRFIGLTGWNGDLITCGRLINSEEFSTIQILYNVLNQSADGLPPIGNDSDQGSGIIENNPNILNQSQLSKVGVIGIRSHAAGSIVEVLDREVDKQTEFYTTHIKALELRKIANKYGINISELALLFCIRNKKISTTVPGVKNRMELQESLNLINKSIGYEIIEEIRNWYKGSISQHLLK
tara:strand:- start:623 stop:1678 length:1056 start_codon:yes stop_codon:yes gene_type:complete